MKKSEELQQLANEEENDFKFWTYHFKANRWRRFEFFMEVLPIIKEQTDVIERENESFTFDVPDVGKVDLYPKSNKALIRSKNKWIQNGLQYIVKRLKIKIDDNMKTDSNV